MKEMISPGGIRCRVKRKDADRLLAAGFRPAPAPRKRKKTAASGKKET